MTALPIIVAIVAVLVAFIALRRAASLQERTDRMMSSIYELKNVLAETSQKLDDGFNQMRLEQRQRAGEAIFLPKMTIAEAMSVHPRVADVLASFHLGGCSHCAVSDVDTIEGACQTYGIDQGALMGALNHLVGGSSGGSTGPGTGVKISNVKVDF